MKIAVLFRGPLRPNIESVLEKVNYFMMHFNGSNAEVHTYLATWRYYNSQKASDLIGLDMFDNVIMQTQPTDEQAQARTGMSYMKNGTAIGNVYRMYYQSKTALDLINSHDYYDYIIHTRTDLYMALDQPELWFNPTYYAAPHVHPQPWMCDQFGIANAEMMHRAWDYGTQDNLNRMLQNASIPENVLQTMMDEAGITAKAAPYRLWQLDDNRNSNI